MDCELRGLVQSSNGTVELCWAAAAGRTSSQGHYTAAHTALSIQQCSRILQQEEERLETSKAQTLSRAAAGIRERYR